jgi:hypothetical protein
MMKSKNMKELAIELKRRKGLSIEEKYNELLERWKEDSKNILRERLTFCSERQKIDLEVRGLKRENGKLKTKIRQIGKIVA